MSGAAATLTTLPDPEWDSLVAGAGTPFRFSHRATAGRAFESAFPSYRYTPLRASFADGTELLIGVVRAQRRLRQLSMAMAMPLGLEGTPVVLRGTLTAEHLEQLFAALGDVGQLVVSGGAGGSPPRTATTSPHVTHVVDLRPGYEALWNGAFGAKTRNMCRKADRAGVVVAIETSEEALGAYYGLYCGAAAGWGYDEPPYPRALVEGMIAGGAAELWIARLDGAVIAGAIVLVGSHDLCYWSAALDREHRNAAPSNAIVRAVIESGCERGFEYIDLGGSEGLPRVEAFKRSFGAEPVEYVSVTLTTGAHRLIEGSRRRLARSGR